MSLPVNGNDVSILINELLTKSLSRIKSDDPNLMNNYLIKNFCG